jgi:hypothetical protein
MFINLFWRVRPRARSKGERSSDDNCQTFELDIEIGESFFPLQNRLNEIDDQVSLNRHYASQQQGKCVGYRCPRRSGRL